MRYGPPASQGKFDKSYVSEFTEFITGFLKEHPEEEQERRKGWFLYWDHKPRTSLREYSREESVPDDRYGFDYAAWHSTNKTGEPDS